MAKDCKKKVHQRDTPKYTSSDDESESSDDDEDLSLLFKGLSFSQIGKINELVKFINENDELLKRREDLLVREHEEYAKLEKALAHEVKKNKILSGNLKVLIDLISLLKIENFDLNDRIKELNFAHASTSTLKHVSICTR